MCCGRRDVPIFEVVTAEGKVAYTASRGSTAERRRAVAESVAKRYPDSTVREVKPAGKK